VEPTVPVSREVLLRLKRRHRGYLVVLITEIILLLLLPLTQHVSWLLSVLMIALCGVVIGFVSRYSALRRTRAVIYTLGALAVFMEILWHLGLRFDPALGRWLTIPHVIAWLVFLTLSLVRKVRTLISEPYVTTSVVMGAASGYLLVGISGGVMLVAIAALSPDSFTVAHQAVAGLANGGSHSLAAVEDAPLLMAASFNILTTIGSAVVYPADVLGEVAVTVITVAGQLYVAILIAMILGRFHRRPR
jgi:hypothetical protein